MVRYMMDGVVRGIIWAVVIIALSSLGLGVFIGWLVF
ncbi:hypothetical protein PJM41_0033 [Salmonella phage vB_SenS_UTK0009]|uniref:Uncharacterized protein n=1 Tax=Salmonella phage vB_SenS_UTK0009 TaxID=3028908 RepID=A0AAE9ZJW1_9CAUD|nr:hypothetical protein PJM41_0033 [Salmonella phage vB_SenS_UTK0009]